MVRSVISSGVRLRPSITDDRAADSCSIPKHLVMSSIQELHSMENLRTVEQIQLLDLVDSLRAEGLSEFTALPQLIVCGDQSSGKSSLLEAISGVPFPRKDNLCTRFATEVILRRAPDSEIRVSLVCFLSFQASRH